MRALFVIIAALVVSSTKPLAALAPARVVRLACS